MVCLASPVTLVAKVRSWLRLLWTAAPVLKTANSKQDILENESGPCSVMSEHSHNVAGTENCIINGKTEEIAAKKEDAEYKEFLNEDLNGILHLSKPLEEKRLIDASSNVQKLSIPKVLTFERGNSEER